MIGQSNSNKATALYSTVTIPIIKITRIKHTKAYTCILMQYGSLLVFSFVMTSHTQNQKPKIDLLSRRNININYNSFNLNKRPKKSYQCHYYNKLQVSLTVAHRPSLNIAHRLNNIKSSASQLHWYSNASSFRLLKQWGYLKLHRIL